jgi:glycosyltransferase involved in cell wall biosynthesis
MDQKHMVSVVMITYNHEKYIAEAIKGVLMQKCDFDIEFIIANDKSTDQTHQVINEIIDGTTIADHINLRYYNHPNNKGMMKNFIWSVQQAKGRYIALCEGDDYWIDPYKLQKQVNILEANPDLAMSTHEASHQSTLVDNDKNLKRFSSIFIRDIQLYGFKRFFYLTYLLVVNRQQFWFQKRTHDKHRRKTIIKLEDFKSNTWYMPMCSILMRNDFIDGIFYCTSKSSGGHQLILLMGAMNGGIYHFKDIMAVKKDQETSVSKDKVRKKKILGINKDPLKNNRIKRFKALQKCAKDPEQVQILQDMIDRELEKIKLKSH